MIKLDTIQTTDDLMLLYHSLAPHNTNNAPRNLIIRPMKRKET